jgi:hypothetical protein
VNTILEGSKQLLLDVADILRCRKDAIFVGGWGPFLRNPGRHPGTLDVDLLFPAKHSREQMAEIGELFLRSGFSVSAKHSFQLLKDYQIGIRRYIFNVDFLHPTLEKSLVTEFRDILDFDITIDGTRVKNLASVCMPYGDVLFFPGLSAVKEVDGRLMRLLCPAGVVFSKLQSCTNPKRPRDIFDILLSCEEEPILWDLLKDLEGADSRVREMLESYRENVRTKWPFFTECLKAYSVVGTVDVQKRLIGEKT